MAGPLSIRDMREDDLPVLFEIQLDDTAHHMAAFVGEAARERESYLVKARRNLAAEATVNKVVERDGEVVGSVSAFPLEGRTEVTYWIRKDCWGQGVATGALALLLAELAVRPVHASAAHDNEGSIRVLERNGFVRIGTAEGFAEARQQTITEVVYRLD
ncbi:GNAT family N-acetyltransferase [Umezawaea tangerina]|uniref:RimJ/RimL family protein N-acetyltransferase n=1 Tax=Umezawaea tangerina TaxID=84725 RepID=A0A2T0T2G9_9PSEU|nr:GNAT family N-acetyltransferase [Umezawaea tangerina]PRY39841.1 RimJ/RimL family protein N-acetyltransferase [Umezawaea tangerina]